jgi:hypothetical protein
MNIRGRIVLSFGGLSLAVGALLVACGSSSSSTPGESTSGQSCEQTADCKSPFVCLNNVCLPNPASMTTTTNSSDASAGDAGDAATTAIGPHLALVGEACQTLSDCSSGLDCVASDYGTVCEPVSYNLTPTGKTCSGQCSTAADCCELPVDAPLEFLNDAGFTQGITVHSCQDVLNALGGSNAPCVSGPQNGQKEACFYYETYCQCAGGTWACSPNNQCQYTAPCTVNSTNTVGGCPSSNRVGASGETTCTIPAGASTGSCLPPGGCTMAADCVGKAVADVSGATCSAAGNCICSNSACYLPCQGNIDCAAGSTCDMATQLCKPAGCSTPSDCVYTTNNVLSTCVSGACKIPCTTDYQCNAGASGSAPTTFSGQVCSSGYCAPLGCSSNSDCTSTEVQMFCVTPPATGEHSAITGGMM